MNYVPLHIHSNYSMLDGITQVKDIVSRCQELGLPGCALTDHDNISGAIAFSSAMQDAGLKPIIGCEIRVAEDASIRDVVGGGHLVLLAKNREGFNQLVQLVSEANKPENFYGKPRVDWNILERFDTSNLFAMSGHVGSLLSNALFTNYKQALHEYEGERIENFITDETKKEAYLIATRLKNIFGDRFFIEVQLLEKDTRPSVVTIGDYMRRLGKALSIPCVAATDAHYARRQDAEDHRVIYTVRDNISFKAMHDRMVKTNNKLPCFFETDTFHIPSEEEMRGFGNTEEELNNTARIFEQCENYKLMGPTVLPKFKCPNGLTPQQYVEQLCEEGFKRLGGRIENVKKNNGLTDEHYRNRLQEEIGILAEAGLFPYFLIVWDIIKYAKDIGSLVGEGRGCLSGNTTIAMGGGLTKKIRDINQFDSVIGSDGEPHIVDKVYKYKLNNDTMSTIYTWYGDGDGMSLTQNHQVLCYGDEPTWKPCGELSTSDYLFTPKGYIEYQNFKHVDLSTYSTGKLIHDEQYCYNTNTSGRFLKRQYSRYIPIDDNLYRMLGLFVGDGCLPKAHKNGIQISCNVKDIDTIEFLDKYFTNLGCVVSHNHQCGDTCVVLDIRCYHLRLWFEDIFLEYENTPQTKHRPFFPFTQPSNIEAFVGGYMEADGYKNNNRYIASTVSSRLAYEIRYLLSCLNIPSSISKKPAHIDKRGWRCQDAYIIRYPIVVDKRLVKQVENGCFCKIRKIIPHKESEFVYDLQVRDARNYLTTSGIVHNSACGSLVLYLLGVTGIDPLEAGLLFSRFYNHGRNTVDHISMPDVDVDVQKCVREEIFAYIREKYGYEKTAQIITFNRLKGRAAIKAVLKAYDVCDNDEINRITACIMAEEAISDKLEEMREARGESSAILWTLENLGSALEQWVSVDDGGKLQGDLAPYFEQALRLEGIRTHHGKHAAGIVIADKPLPLICPMLLDKNTGLQIAAFEFTDLEKMGLLKLDILVTSVLDKMHNVVRLVRGEAEA